MFNRIMQIQIREIETTSPVRAVEEIGSEFRDEEAEGGGEVEGLSDFGVEFFKGYVLAVVREDAVVCHRVEHGAGRSGIAIFWGHVLRPGEVLSGCMWGNDLAGLMGRSNDVEDEEGEVPREEENVDEEAGDFVKEAHFPLVIRFRSWGVIGFRGLGGL